MDITTFTRLGGKAAFILTKHAPKILTAVGLTAGGAAIIFAAKDAGGSAEAIERFLAARGRIRSTNLPEEEYPKAHQTRDMAVVYATFVKEWIVANHRPIIAGSVAVASILFAQGLLEKRLSGALAAYAALETSFMKYRGAATKVLGAKGIKQLQAQLYTDSEDDIDKDGPEGNKIFDSDLPLSHDLSQYARVFAPDTTTEWSNVHDYNLSRIRMLQNSFNEVLHRRGHVFLNEVYDQLGLERTPAGAVTGWVWDGTEDSTIAITTCVASEEFAGFGDDSYAYKTLALDFNVDGLIWNRI